MIKLNNKKGFTLIELMIVIAIIGILAAIAIPNFIAYRNKSLLQPGGVRRQQHRAPRLPIISPFRRILRCPHSMAQRAAVAGT